MKKITIYTDGRLLGETLDPAVGAHYYITKAIAKSYPAAEPHTTNNRMELMAAIAALEALKEPCQADIYTDSAYLYRAFQDGWLKSWQKNNWKTSTKKDVENQDLWKRLLAQTSVHQVVWHKVKGHSDNADNNRCDALARAAIAKFR